MTTRAPICYGRDYARRFHLREAPSLLVKRLSHVQLAVTRLTSDTGMPWWSISVPPERAFLISVHLTEADITNWRVSVAGRHTKVASCAAGGIGIYDLECDPREFRDTSFDSLHYNLPRTTLQAFTEDCGLPSVDALHCDPGTRDQVLFHLSHMLLPQLASDRLSALFLDHFVLMFCCRLVDAYGSVATPLRVRQGGLAPWQMRRTRELVDHHLTGGDLRLATLAQECGLSVSHFACAFRRSFGSSVHRYIILQRVESAKALLSQTEHSLAEVALQTGFSDQAAFTRTFCAIVGTSPGRWRRKLGRLAKTQTASRAWPSHLTPFADKFVGPIQRAARVPLALQPRVATPNPIHEAP